MYIADKNTLYVKGVGKCICFLSENVKIMTGEIISECLQCLVYDWFDDTICYGYPHPLLHCLFSLFRAHPLTLNICVLFLILNTHPQPQYLCAVPYS